MDGDSIAPLGIALLALMLALAGVVLPEGGGGMIEHGNEWHDPDFAYANHTHTLYESNITDLVHDALKIRGVDIDNSSLASNYILVFNGSHWICEEKPSGSNGSSKGLLISGSISQYSTSTYYFGLEYSGLSSTQGQKVCLMPAVTLLTLKFYCYQFDATKGDDVWVTLLKNGVETDLAINVTDLGVYDVDFEVSVSENDLLEYKSSGSGSGYMRGSATLIFEFN